jgi:RNAse (barnase) inhibitor barstar
MRSLADYLAKIPPEHAGDTNFMAELSLVLQPFVDIQALVNSLPSLFDLDNAIGVQLDATGLWDGITRNVPVPVPNPWFSFDTVGLGFDQGYWQGPFDGVGLTSLDDTTFRRLIRAKIAANNCDGLQPAILACLTTYFDPVELGAAIGSFVIGESEIGIPSTLIGVYDATDPIGANGLRSAGLAMGVVIAGQIPNAVDLAILGQLLIPFKPAAVDVIWGVTTINDNSVFGFDVENIFISGFDVGAWGASPATVAALGPYSTNLHPIMAQLLAPINPLDLGITNQAVTLMDNLGAASASDAVTASVDLGTAP